MAEPKPMKLSPLVIILMLYSHIFGIEQAYALSGETGLPTWAYWSVGILCWLAFLVIVALRGARKQRSVEVWLNKHYSSLPKKARRKLMELRNERRGKVRYPRKWRAVSAAIRKERPSCEVCGSKSRHVHHRRYRRFGRDRPRNLIALCRMCHYFIHPHGNMTWKAFKQYRKGR